MLPHYLVAELASRIETKFGCCCLERYQSAPRSLATFLPEERFLFAANLILPVALRAPFFRVRGVKYSTRFWDCEEKQHFVPSELWTLVSDAKPVAKLKAADDWRAYLFTTLMNNTRKHFNDQRQWRRGKPKHGIEQCDHLDSSPAYLPTTPIEDAMYLHPEEALELREQFDRVTASAARGKRWLAELDDALSDLESTLDALDISRDEAAAELRRLRRNFRDRLSRNGADDRRGAA